MTWAAQIKAAANLIVDKRIALDEAQKQLAHSRRWGTEGQVRIREERVQELHALTGGLWLMLEATHSSAQVETIRRVADKLESGG